MSHAPVVTLMPHQQVVHDFLVAHPFANAWLGVGSGKTVTTLTTLQTVRPTGHILVVAPLNIARSTWIDEIEDWGFPFRTKSLIVDEKDKKLSLDERLRRFRDVFTDPPTMYFINKDLLTQPSKPEHLLMPQSVPAGAGQPSADAERLMDLFRSIGPMTKEQTLLIARHVFSQNGAKPPAKSHITAWIRELTGLGLLVREVHACRACGGEGCKTCKTGLIDQLPMTTITHNGKKHTVAQWPFPTLVIDEAQGFRSHDSERFKALAAVRPAMSRVIELTGTPAPKGLHDLWSQMYLLDQGLSLGHNITAYRDRWFSPKMVAGTNTPAQWIPHPFAEAEIHQAISHMTISVQNVDLGLDEPLIDDVFVTMPDDLEDTYAQFQRDLVIDVVMENLTEDQCQSGQPPSEAVIRQIVAQNQAALNGKLLQFANGALYTDDPDEGPVTGAYTVLHDAKLDMAAHLIEQSAAAGENTLVAYSFRSDKERLLARLTADGVRVQQFNGSRDMIHRWNRGEIEALLLHPASAGHGLNLQKGGRTLMWFGLPYDLEFYQQTIGRLQRKGQSGQVIIQRLLTRKTKDTQLPGVLALKAAVQDRLIDAVDAEKRGLTLPQLQHAIVQAETADIDDAFLDAFTMRWNTGMHSP